MFEDLVRAPFRQTLVGERLRLVRAHPELSRGLWESILRDRKSRGSSWRWLTSEGELKEYLSKTASEIPDHEIVYLIHVEERVIGTFHIHSLNYLDHKAELGYAIEKTHEGFGYVSEALQLVERELKRLRFNKAIISCNVENSRSLRVAERSGYNREGTLIQDCIENGKFRDSALFGKIL